MLIINNIKIKRNAWTGWNHLKLLVLVKINPSNHLPGHRHVGRQKDVQSV